MKRTTINITEEDRAFCEEHHLGYTELLREAIFQHREALNGEIVENVQIARAKLQSWIRQAQKLRDFIDAKGLTEEFLGSEK